MSNSSRVLLLAAAVCLLGPAAVSAQHTFSTDWTQGKRDVSAQQQLLAAAAAATDGGPRPSPSLLDVLSRAAAQPAADQQCKPDAEALGLIYDLIMVSRTFPFRMSYNRTARSAITRSAAPPAAVQAVNSGAASNG